MKAYIRDKNFYMLVIAGILFFAPINRFYIENSFKYWPFYHWEIGFGQIPFEAERPAIFIKSVDGKKLEKPERITDYFNSRKLKWNVTKDYLIQKELLHSWHRGDTRRIEKLLVKKYFRRFAKKKVTYSLNVIRFDPLEYLEKKKFIRNKELFEVHVEW